MSLASGVEPVPTRRPVLVYDADCGFCNRWVSRLKRWDRRDAIELLPLTDPIARALTNHDQSALRQAVHLVLPGGELLAGAAAARGLCAFLPLGWLPRTLLHLPGALYLADRAYHWIARTWGPVGNRIGRGTRGRGGATDPEGSGSPQRPGTL